MRNWPPGPSVFFVIAGFLLFFLCISFSYGGVNSGTGAVGLLCQKAVTFKPKNSFGRKKGLSHSEQPYLIKTLDSWYGGKWRLDREEERKLILEYQETGSEPAFNRLLYSHIRIMWQVILQVTFEWGASAMALHVREEILSNIVRDYHRVLAKYDTGLSPRLASFALYKIEERTRRLMRRYLMSLRTFEQSPHALENIIDDSSGYSPHEESVYFEQVVTAVNQIIEEMGFSEREVSILRNYVFTDSPVSVEVIGKEFNITGSSVRNLARRLLQRIAGNETVISEVRGLARNKLSSTKKPPRRKAPPPEDPIEDIADFEKVMELSLQSMESFSLTPEEKAVVERYLLSKNPEFLRTVGESLKLSYNEVLYLKNKVVKKILRNKTVPPEVKNFIRWRVKFSSRSGGRMVILSPEEIELGLKILKNMELTRWEIAVLERHVFTNHPETFKAIGADIGSREQGISERNAKFMDKISKDENFPACLQTVIERKLISGKKSRSHPAGVTLEGASCGGI